MEMDYIGDLRTKTSHYIIAGFSLVVGLSWNETIKQFINTIFPLASEAMYFRLIYSLIITFLLVIIIKYLPDTSSQLPDPVKRELFHNKISRLNFR